MKIRIIIAVLLLSSCAQRPETNSAVSGQSTLNTQMEKSAEKFCSQKNEVGTQKYQECVLGAMAEYFKVVEEDRQARNANKVTCVSIPLGDMVYTDCN